MASFQPGLNFNAVKRAEIVSRLHGKFQPEASWNFSRSFSKNFKCCSCLLFDLCEHRQSIPLIVYGASESARLWLHSKIEQTQK